MVIYSGGLRPYLFSISLMLGSGFPPALPWPTGRRVWVGPLQKLPRTSTTNTLSLTLSFPTSPPLLPCSLLSLTCFHFMYTVSQSLPNILTHKHSLSLQLIHTHCLSPFVSLLLSRSCLPSADSSFKRSITCKHPHRHAHTHLGRQSHTLTWIIFTAPSQPQPPPPHYSLSTADVMLANTFHFL